MPVIFYVLFIVSVIPIMLSWVSVYFRYKEFNRVDNHYPRQQQSELTGVGARAVAAQKNAWETLIIFLLTTFVAHASGVNMDHFAVVSVVFFVLRVLHFSFYLANLGALRTLVYVAGMFCCLYIFGFSALHYGQH